MADTCQWQAGRAGMWALMKKGVLLLSHLHMEDEDEDASRPLLIMAS